MGSFINNFVQFVQAYGIAGLIAVSFAESSFFPIPPDVLLIPMAFMNKNLALLYALLTTVSSVIGGIFGHFLGKKFGKPFLKKLFKEESINKVENYFDKYGGWSIAVAGFTPIPYKIFTISAGAFNVRISTLIAASIFGRGARFFLEGLIILFFGDTAKYLISNYFEVITVAITAVLILGYYIWKKLKNRDKVKSTGIMISIKEKYNKIYSKMYNFAVKYIKYNKSMIYFLVGICLSLISLFTFLEIVDRYLDIGKFGIDSVISAFFTEMRSPVLTGVIKVVTSSGNFTFILVISIIIMLLLIRKKKKKEALFYSLSITGIWLFNEILKSIFKRPRPIGIHLVNVTDYSFPSAHAMVFMGFSLLIVYYIIENVKSIGMRIVLSMLMILYALLVGLSRVYLGVHYFSDVFAGWMAAVLWVSVMIMIYKILVSNHKKSQSEMSK